MTNRFKIFSRLMSAALMCTLIITMFAACGGVDKTSSATVVVTVNSDAPEYDITFSRGDAVKSGNVYTLRLENKAKLVVTVSAENYKTRQIVIDAADYVENVCERTVNLKDMVMAECEIKTYADGGECSVQVDDSSVVVTKNKTSFSLSVPNVTKDYTVKVICDGYVTRELTLKSEELTAGYVYKSARLVKTGNILLTFDIADPKYAPWIYITELHEFSRLAQTGTATQKFYEVAENSLYELVIDNKRSLLDTTGLGAYEHSQCLVGEYHGIEYIDSVPAGMRLVKCDYYFQEIQYVQDNELSDAQHVSLYDKFNDGEQRGYLLPSEAVTVVAYEDMRDSYFRMFDVPSDFEGQLDWKLFQEPMQRYVFKTIDGKFLSNYTVRTGFDLDYNPIMHEVAGEVLEVSEVSSIKIEGYNLRTDKIIIHKGEPTLQYIAAVPTTVKLQIVDTDGKTVLTDSQVQVEGETVYDAQTKTFAVSVYDPSMVDHIYYTYKNNTYNAYIYPEQITSGGIIKIKVSSLIWFNYKQYTYTLNGREIDAHELNDVDIYSSMVTNGKKISRIDSNLYVESGANLLVYFRSGNNQGERYYANIVIGSGDFEVELKVEDYKPQW